jgi:hypothetical protein
MKEVSILRLLLAATFLVLCSGCMMTVRPTSHRAAEIELGPAAHPMGASGDPHVRWSRHHEAPPERAERMR